MKADSLVIALTRAAAAPMSGCAMDQSISQRATAVAVGGNAVAPEQVRISDEHTVLESFGQSVHWHASAPNGEFDCSAIPGQGILIQPVCVKK